MSKLVAARGGVDLMPHWATNRSTSTCRRGRGVRAMRGLSRPARRLACRQRVPTRTARQRRAAAGAALARPGPVAMRLATVHLPRPGFVRGPTADALADMHPALLGHLLHHPVGRRLWPAGRDRAGGPCPGGQPARVLLLLLRACAGDDHRRAAQFARAPRQATARVARDVAVAQFVAVARRRAVAADLRAGAGARRVAAAQPGRIDRGRRRHCTATRSASPPAWLAIAGAVLDRGLHRDDLRLAQADSRLAASTGACRPICCSRCCAAARCSRRD